MVRKACKPDRSAQLAICQPTNALRHWKSGSNKPWSKSECSLQAHRGVEKAEDSSSLCQSEREKASRAKNGT